MAFRIGDRVQFKDYEEIKRLQDEGELSFGFNERMKPLCGMVFTIKSFSGVRLWFEEDCEYLYQRYPKSKDPEERDWFITKELLEPFDEQRFMAEENLISDKLFLDMLLS